MNDSSQNQEEKKKTTTIEVRRRFMINFVLFSGITVSFLTFFYLVLTASEASTKTRLLLDGDDTSRIVKDEILLACRASCEV